MNKSLVSQKAVHLKPPVTPKVSNQKATHILQASINAEHPCCDFCSKKVSNPEDLGQKTVSSSENDGAASAHGVVVKSDTPCCVVS